MISNFLELHNQLSIRHMVNLKVDIDYKVTLDVLLEWKTK